MTAPTPGTPDLRPPATGDPTALGAYAVVGRLTEHAAGVVFLGRDRQGRHATLAVLHTAAASDSAVRDRLQAAVEARPATTPGGVLAAAPREPLPWAALAYDPGAPTAGAVELLDAAALAPAVGTAASSASGPGAGPDFAPHWTGTPASTSLTPAPTPGSPGPTPTTGSSGSMPDHSRRSLLVLAGSIIGALVLIAGAGWAVYTWTGVSSGEPQAGQTPDSILTFDPQTPAPSLSPSPSDRPSAAPTGPPGLVAGPTYADGEDTYHMDLQGFPFEFDAPSGWGCVASSKGGPGVVRWVCIDEGGTFPPKSGGAGGIIEVRKCPAPCTADQRKEFRSTVTVDASEWKPTDSSTRYAEVKGELDGEVKVRVAMGHAFAVKPGDPPDRHVIVALTGAPSDKSAMQKLINEIRKRTP